MERLSDIIDQNPELGHAGDAEQIALPSIQGAVRFEDVKFRFGDTSRPYQVDRVSLSIETGILLVLSVRVEAVKARFENAPRFSNLPQQGSHFY